MIGALLALALAIDAPTQQLSLDEALRQAVAHQPELQSARYDVDAASAVLTQAKSIEYPQVNLDAQVFAGSDNGAATAYLSAPDFVRIGTRPGAYAGDGSATPFVSTLGGVGAHYDLLDFGYTHGVVGAAEAGLDATTQQQRQTLQNVLLRVASAYYGTLAAQQVLAVAQDTQKRAQTDDAYAEAGVRAGLRPPIDRARSEAELQAARLGVIRAQNALSVSIAGLDTAIGWAPPEPYALSEPSADTRPVPDAKQAADQALGARFDLAALQAQERALDSQRSVAYSRNFPRLIASSALDLRGFAGAPDTVNYDVGLVLDVPLFTGFAIQGAVQEVDARLASLRARESALRDAIGYQLRQSRETLLSAREAIQASLAQVEAAKAGLSQATVRYQQGLGNIVELTDAEAQYDVAQLGLVQSRLAAAVSRVQLDYALGQLRVP